MRLQREPLGVSRPAEVREFLWKFLEDLVPGDTNSSGRGKTLTVLTRIWLAVPPKSMNALRDAALPCHQSATGEQRIAIHWAMAIGTHPFFYDVVANVGKLLILNGQVNRSQIKRRMTDSWGDRSTLERTIQHVLRSVRQWGLLRDGPDKGSLDRTSAPNTESVMKSVSYFFTRSCSAMGAACRSHNWSPIPRCFHSMFA